MRGRAVEAPDGRSWTVYRRLWWRPGRETVWRRFARRARDPLRWGRTAWEVADAGSAVGGLSELPVIGMVFLVIALGALVVALVLLVGFFLLPLLLAAVELAVLLILAGLSVGVRLALRKRCYVEAVADDGEHLSWQVDGWRDSGTRRDQIAASLAAGIVPPPDTAPADVGGG